MPVAHLFLLVRCPPFPSCLLSPFSFKRGTTGGFLHPCFNKFPYTTCYPVKRNLIAPLPVAPISLPVCCSPFPSCLLSPFFFKRGTTGGFLHPCFNKFPYTTCYPVKRNLIAPLPVAPISLPVCCSPFPSCLLSPFFFKRGTTGGFLPSRRISRFQNPDNQKKPYYFPY